MTAATDRNLAHLRKMATPSRLGVTVGQDFMGKPYVPYAWILQVEKLVLEALVDPAIRIIILNVPPQNGKTTTFGMLLSAWYLGMNPHDQVIFMAYNEEYAAEWGAKTRNLLQRYGRDLFGVDVSSVNDSKANWRMSNDFGGMLSVGWTGGATGRPGNLIVIDDLIKTMEEAGSANTLRKQLDEFDGALGSRFQDAQYDDDGVCTKPGTTVLITATRFAEADVSGELIARAQRAAYEGTRIDVISIPALAEAPEELEEDEDWRDFLGRAAGEGLPGRFSQGFYEERRASLCNADGSDGFVWSAVYQQNPSSRTGGMFPKHFWRYYTGAPPCPMVRRVRVWDCAATAGGGDFTVGSLFGKGTDGNFYLLDRVRFQGGSGDVEAKVKLTAEVDGFGVKIIIEQERAGAGKSFVEHFQRLLTGYIVEPGKAEVSKEQRAMTYSAFQNQGRVFLPEDDPVLVKEWVEEHRKMMGDGRKPRHDDQIDTGAYAIIDLNDGAAMHLFIPGEQGSDDLLESAMQRLVMEPVDSTPDAVAIPFGDSPSRFRQKVWA